MRKLSVVIPKGSIFESVTGLMNDAGIDLRMNDRAYRPLVSDPELEVKIMRPQNIPELIELGSHDAGFTGFDWIAETNADVMQVLDLGLDPVKIVAAIPKGIDPRDLRTRRIVVASEYEYVSKKFLDHEGYDYVFLRTYGATEVFPPDDADMIIDNTSSGRTLVEHDLIVLATLMTSSTRFIANKRSYEDPSKREKFDEMRMVFKAILDARLRVMLEMNIPKERFNDVVSELPCMRAPTVSPLYNDQGFAVKIAVPRAEVSRLVPRLKKLGAMDIVEYDLRKVVA
ncbi:ATP phosphoribosyltransferase [candidate division WOR-3 bacterium]|nr:ATP phosphoribosyltransferase [candidate division WOR-3 bacterium]